MFTRKHMQALKHRHTPPETPFEQLAVLNISGCVFALLRSCAHKRSVSLGEDVDFAFHGFRAGPCV